MLNDTDRAFIESVSARLLAGKTYQEIADEEGMPLGTLYGRIRGLGYKTQKRLVPIHAEPINPQGQAA